LLQWLAVQAARRSFDGALAPWNEAVPFFIQLRRTLGGSLPGPEEFPGQVAQSIAGAMPHGWAHRKLQAGALVLIDGVDEVPESQRADVRKWLQDFVANFENAHFIVTSRPAAVKEGWLSGEGFGESELQPMGLPDIDALIDQWHLAAGMQLGEDQLRIQLDEYKGSLKHAVRTEPSIRNLATSPLLCAMLCILNWDRKKQLPKDRMELYRVALDMLLERRDIERETPTEDTPKLSRKDKELLLQEFAYWLLRNNRSDAERAEAVRCLSGLLKFMPRIKSGGGHRPSEPFGTERPHPRTRTGPNRFHSSDVSRVLGGKGSD
jgi:predicted NACHT family NTPase